MTQCCITKLKIFAGEMDHLWFYVGIINLSYNEMKTKLNFVNVWSVCSTFDKAAADHLDSFALGTTL